MISGRVHKFNSHAVAGAVVVALLLVSCSSVNFRPQFPTESSSDGLTLLVHGVKGSPRMWSDQIDAEIAAHGLTEDAWQIVRLDWREISDTAIGSPGRGYRLGVRIGTALSTRSNPYHVLHLIGHSMGAHVIQGVADAYRENVPDAIIHMTFIDSFVARGPFTLQFGKRAFGRNSDFAESYVTTHGPPVFTNALLSRAHNFDLSFNIPIDRRDDRHYAHIWPVHFYLRSGADGPGLSLAPYAALAHLGAHYAVLRAQYPAGQVTAVRPF